MDDLLNEFLTETAESLAVKLDNGNYLVPHLLAFKVKEYTPKGEVVNEIITDREELGGRAEENWPFTAIKLKNGNVLINLTHGNKTIEVNEAGEIVWKLSNDDFDGNPRPQGQAYDIGAFEWSSDSISAVRLNCTETSSLCKQPDLAAEQ